MISNGKIGLIRKTIKLITENQDLISQSINEGIYTPITDRQILNIIEKINNRSQLMNTVVACKALELIQLLNDDSNVEQFELTEISDLYRILLKNAPMDISLYESAYCFEDSVMDKPAEAKDLLLMGIRRIEEKIASLKDQIS